MQFLLEKFSIYGYFLYYTVVFIVVIIVVLDNRPPIRTISWIVVLTFIPFLGVVVYFFFGRSLKTEKLYKQKGEQDASEIERLYEEPPFGLPHPSLVGREILYRNKNLIRLLQKSGKSRLSSQNRMKVLQDGPDTYNEILQCLALAKKHIHLEYYIFEEGKVANQIKDILIDKAQRGVSVRFIYDGVGSWSLSDGYISSLEQSGVEVFPFRPVRFPSFTSKLNYRNHRKIVVVDGRIGFLGGINISDKYIKVDEDMGVRWRDTHLRIEGDAVNDLQLVFLTDWYYVSERVIEPEADLFAVPEVEDNCHIQIVGSGPDTDQPEILNTYFAAIASATRSIKIITPYFIPNESVMLALVTAALSGVDVVVIFPGISDSKVVQYSSRSYFEKLLHAGVKVYLYHGGFIHAKVLVVDGEVSSIGTANMDFRSFEQNMEVNAVIYDESVSKTLEHQIELDLAQSTLLELGSWVRRDKWQKIKESFARIFAPLF